MKAIADTGLMVAFGNRTDRFHSWAVEIARNIQVNAAPFLYRPGGPTEFSPRRKPWVGERPIKVLSPGRGGRG